MWIYPPRKAPSAWSQTSERKKNTIWNQIEEKKTHQLCFINLLDVEIKKRKIGVQATAFNPLPFASKKKGKGKKSWERGCLLME